MTTMAETMKEAGFETGAVLANPFIRDKYGFAQGFDHFEEILVSQYARGEIINQAALKWLENRTGDRPFFLYLHYMDVHGPYNAPKAVMEPLISAVGNVPNKQPMDQDGMGNLRYLLKQADYHGEENRDAELIQYPEYWRARYDAGVRDMDNQIGALKKQLEMMGVWNDAYVIVTSDHGEQLYEHGNWDHGRTVHDYEVRVPLILRWPMKIAPNLRIGSTVQLIDLFPTLATQLEMNLPGGAQGRSLVPLLDQDPSWEPMPAFAEDVKVGHEQQAVYWGDWKLIHTPVEKADAFYDHRSSLSEKTPATSIDDGVKAELRRLRAQWVEKNEELGNQVEGETVPLTPAEQDRLRNIGYTD
jgi:arylsulfatase A-like enzyme